MGDIDGEKGSERDSFLLVDDWLWVWFNKRGID